MLAKASVDGSEGVARGVEEADMGDSSLMARGDELKARMAAVVVVTSVDEVDEVNDDDDDDDVDVCTLENDGEESESEGGRDAAAAVAESALIVGRDNDSDDGDDMVGNSNEGGNGELE